MCNVDARRGAWSVGTRGGNLARPEGVGRAPPTFEIEGVDVLVEVLRAA
jgi:hypothetical protein